MRLDHHPRAVRGDVHRVRCTMLLVVLFYFLISWSLR